MHIPYGPKILIRYHFDGIVFSDPLHDISMHREQIFRRIHFICHNDRIGQSIGDSIP